jgi:transposase, IS5 family
MSQPRDDCQDDLFRPSLNEIINLRHPLVRLAGEIDWDFLAGRFSSVCGVGPGQPPLPTRSLRTEKKRFRNLFVDGRSAGI